MSRMNGWALAVGLLLVGWAQAADAPRQTGTVLLTLAEGVAPAGPDDRGTRDMELELTLRDGKFEKDVYGFAVTFNKGHHEGEVVAQDGEKLTVKMTLNKDKWWPPRPGTAEYEITLKREGDSYTGSFKGTFATPDAGGAKPNAPVTPATLGIDTPKADWSAGLVKGTSATARVEGTAQPAGEVALAGKGNSAVDAPGLTKREVLGKVTGKVYPLWTEPPAGFKKLEPNEHPRLVFRKSDLPMLKKRMETPEGKAIMERFLAVLPKQYANNQKNQPFFPAGYGLAYQLTGDKAHADKAKEIMDGMLGLGGAQDIHYGPQAQSMAVTLDFCYDAWDVGFRQKVIDNLARRVSNLETLTGMGGASLNPWHNHEAIRACGAGMGAICLLGEKTSDGKEIPGLERTIGTTTRSTRRFFQSNGTSNTGWGLEGNFYKRMTWNSGPGHMVQAYRTAFGGDMMAGWWGHWSILGEWMWQPPADRVVSPEGLGDDQSAGLFVMGMTVVPDSMKPGARWLFDRAYGLEGDKTFAILWAYHAGYLLMNYPFDVAPKPPAESLPWIAPDPTGGHWIFRKPWQGANDTLVVLNPRFDNPGGTHWIVGRCWDMQLFALGKQWVGDRVMSEASDGKAGAALPTVADKGAYNDTLNARLASWSSTDNGKAILSFDMSPIYLQSLPRGGSPGAGQKMAKFPRSGSFADLGISAKRYLALDLSGASGAPVLFVAIDKASGAKDFTWNLKLSGGAGAGKVEGNTVTAGDTAAENLKCAFVAPKAPTLTGAIKATGGDEYFVVITVQKGAAPEMKVEGEGLAAKVTVGGQTIRFDGEKIVLEK